MPSSTLLGTRSLLFSPAHTRLAGPGASVGSISHLSSNCRHTLLCQALCGEQTQVLTVGWPSPQLDLLDVGLVILSLPQRQTHP